MSRYTLGFVTHRTLESLLGGEGRGAQQRRRLIARGWLTDAPMCRADRFQLAIYPEFELAALATGARPAEGVDEALRFATVRARALYETEAFGALADALAQALREVRGYGLAELVGWLAEEHPEALRAWREEVGRMESELEEVSISVEAAPGRVTEAVPSASGLRYAVDVSGAIEHHIAAEAPVPLSPGSEVLRDRIHLGPVVRSFLLPVRRAALASVGEQQEVGDEEAFFHALFDGLEPEVRQVPHLTAARPAVDRPPPVDDDVRIDVPWNRLAGASTMSRSGA